MNSISLYALILILCVGAWAYFTHPKAVNTFVAAFSRNPMGESDSADATQGDTPPPPPRPTSAVIVSPTSDAEVYNSHVRNVSQPGAESQPETNAPIQTNTVDNAVKPQ